MGGRSVRTVPAEPQGALPRRMVGFHRARARLHLARAWRSGSDLVSRQTDAAPDASAFRSCVRTSRERQMSEQRLLIEMGIGWTRNKKDPSKLTSATPGEYATEIARLRRALSEVLKAENDPYEIASEALRFDMSRLGDGA